MSLVKYQRVSIAIQYNILYNIGTLRKLWSVSPLAIYTIYYTQYDIIQNKLLDR